VGDSPTAEAPALIVDRYIDGTALRLRELTVDDETVWKLAQKVRSDPSDPAMVSITNLYLTRDEHRVLASLPAAEVRKVRSVCLLGGVRFVVDTFGGELAGLRLAEVEVDDLSSALPKPAWLGREVSHDDRYSGGRLARTSAVEVAALVTAPT
jgi:CYTH domain-containing protein